MKDIQIPCALMQKGADKSILYSRKENILNPQDDFKYELEFKDFFTPLQDCIDRDQKRPNPIGEEVIRKTYEKYKNILEDGKDNSSKDTSGSLCNSQYSKT